MNKAKKLIPSILLLILCVGMVAFGIYAASPTTNKISGTIKVISSSTEVEITGYIDGVVDFETDTTRTGIEWYLTEEKLSFNLSEVNKVSEIPEIIITLKVKNLSKTQDLGVYFYNGVGEKQNSATLDDIRTFSTISDQTGVIANAYFSSYSHLAKCDDEGQDTKTAIDEIEMKINICAAVLRDATATFDYYLNIESYSSTLNDTSLLTTGTSINSPSYTGLTGLVKLNPQVTEIPDYAFSSNNAQCIVIPNGVTSIGTSAFEACIYLEKVNLPNMLTTINKNAFKAIPIKSVNLKQGITTYGSNIYDSCGSLIHANIPSDFNSQRAFYGCHTLTKVTLDNNLSAIPSNAFTQCTSLETIFFPENLNAINGYAFYGCTSLTGVVLPQGLITIGEGAFKDCTQLSSIIIPNGVQTISKDAFLNCSSLKFVTLNEGVQTIGQTAFSNCQLIEVNIPSTITTIAEDAFDNNTFEKISVKASNTTQIAAYTLPTTLTKTGYTFGGWYIKVGSTTLTVTQITDRDINTTYYVNWVQE